MAELQLSELNDERLRAYDLVVVGSSFAARPIVEGLAPGRRVLVVEGGDRAESEAARQLTLNDEYGHMADGHWSAHWVRAVGGTSRRWAGVVVPLDPEDVDGSGGVPSWPLGYDDLARWYPAACAFLGRPDAVAAPAAPWRDGLRLRPLSHDVPRRLHDDFDEVARRQGVDVLLRTHVVRLTAASRRAVDGLVVSDAADTTRVLPLRPRQLVVLACGGLGNAHVLLQPPDGDGVPVGNESGLVGRYLMEHPHVVGADVLIDRSRLPAAPAGFGPSLPALMLDAAVRRAHGLLTCTLAVQGPVDVPDAADERAYFQERFGRPLDHVALFARSEQEPSPLNLVELLPDRNAAGAFRLRTRCSFSSRDLQTIELTTRLVGERLLAAAIGVVRLRNTAIYRETMGGGHTMGTTRMGRDPRTSVCDGDLRVHGYDNLYLSGSSVFPSGGAANPTLTVVALACRLAAHLRDRLGTTP